MFFVQPNLIIVHLHRRFYQVKVENVESFTEQKLYQNKV